MVRRYNHWIGNAEVVSSSKRWIDRRSPATGELVAQFAEGTADDTRLAIESARLAFEEGEWSRFSGEQRAAILRRAADLIAENRERLARLDAEEVGKPIRFVRGEIDAIVRLTQWAAAMALRLSGEVFSNLGPEALGLVTREPIGVVGMIVPWNFPAKVMTQKVPFALAAGCTCVVKPSEFTSSSAIEFARLYAEAGLPAGVFNVVTGYGDPVGETLTTDPAVDMISFTGSTRTGRRILTNSAATVKKVAVELGGKAANIVFADADLTAAIDGVLTGIYVATGQVCCSGTRLLVEEKIADEFTERLAGATSRLRLGLPFDEKTDVGSLIHEDHLAKVLGYVAQGQAAGARLRQGGARVIEGVLASGCYVAPTILDRVEPSNPVFREEIFGPVLSVSTFKTTSEAIHLANDTRYGLANGLWTKDIDKAMEVSRALRSGTVYLNNYYDEAPQMPFGGYRESGNGREMGVDGVLEFTELKTTFLRIGRGAANFVRA
jgi:acyl-CoA reductase-like NAD-dependent aldehyde dehydrogenase